MRALPLSCVATWGNVQNWWTPRSIDTNCPFCRRQVNLPLSNFSFDAERKTMAASAVCPGCRENVSLWIIDPGPANDSSKKGCSCLAIFPAAQGDHKMIEGSEFIPDPIRQAYQEAIQVYNAKVWSGTATLCRRTLEGMVIHLTGHTPPTPTLNAMLRELPSKVDLAKPITSLANSVRLGGNIGTHFSVDSVPDENLARTMLELLEYLLEYFFAIPMLIENAQAVIDKPTP
jgi:hypothetical protein